MGTEETSKIVRHWYDCIARGDVAAILDGLAEDIEFVLPKTDYNQIIPYMGKHVGREQVAAAFERRAQTISIEAYEIKNFIFQDNRAAAIAYTRATGIDTGESFVLEDVHVLSLNEEGKIATWKAYFDSAILVEALSANLSEKLLKSVEDDDLEGAERLLRQGADVNARDASSGLSALMIASGKANPAMVKMLIGKGADVFAVDNRAGGSALHKACQGGSVDVVKLLVEAGAFVDWVASTTGHTPLMDALWFKYPDVVGYLLEQGAGLNLSTHYGFSLMEHLKYELNVNVIGKERLIQSDKMVRARQDSDQKKIEKQKLMAAVNDNDIATVKKLIQSGAEIDARYPVLNGFNDAHTPLLVACRDGHTEIVAELLKAGADVNAVEPTFMAVPLHKAVYNGHADITKLLVDQPGIDINFQGATNGYSPLHDALWHGYSECAQILLNAGARIDLKGHDGKTPLVIATEVFGQDHEMVKLIRSKL